MSFLVDWWEHHVRSLAPRPPKPMSHLEWGACVQKGTAHPLDPPRYWLRWDRTLRSIEEAWMKHKSQK